jgi:hypothetical protein
MEEIMRTATARRWLAERGRRASVAPPTIADLILGLSSRDT